MHHREIDATPLVFAACIGGGIGESYKCEPIAGRLI